MEDKDWDDLVVIDSILSGNRQMRKIKHYLGTAFNENVGHCPLGLQSTGLNFEPGTEHAKNIQGYILGVNDARNVDLHPPDSNKARVVIRLPLHSGIGISHGDDDVLPGKFKFDSNPVLLVVSASVHEVVRGTRLRRLVLDSIFPSIAIISNLRRRFVLLGVIRFGDDANTGQARVTYEKTGLVRSTANLLL
jgi:hypothetical protein